MGHGERGCLQNHLGTITKTTAMKHTLLLVVLTAGLVTTHAQQSLPREEMLRAAFMLTADLKQMLSTPIPTDPDVKRPVAMREGPRGMLVLPETKLSAETFAKAGKEVVPLGQLWLRQLSLEGVKPDQLHQVTVKRGDSDETAILCALGARRDASGKWELVIYGKTTTPLLTAPLKAISATQENPIEISAELQGSSALVTLKIAGKFEASFTAVPE